MLDPKSEIIQMAFDIGKDFSKVISDSNGNQFFNLIIADHIPLFEEAFLVGCYKNHPKITQKNEPEYDQNLRMNLFIDLIKNYGNNTKLTISYNGKGATNTYHFNLCEIDENSNRILIHEKTKKTRDTQTTKWINGGRQAHKQPCFPTRPIEISHDPKKSNVLNYYLTSEVIETTGKKYNPLVLIERSRTRIYDLLELPQPGTTGAKDETLLVKGLKNDTLQLWENYGYWENPESTALDLGLINEKKNSWSLAKLFNCDSGSIPDTPIQSPFGEIVFARNINNDISNKKIIILSGSKAFEKIDFIKTSSAAGVVLIISMKNILKFGLDRFREKIRTYIHGYSQYGFSSQILTTSSFKSKSLCWAKNPQNSHPKEPDSPDSNILDLTVNLIDPNIEKTSALIRLHKIITSLLPKDQNQGRTEKIFIWDIYNRLFRGGSYDIGNLACYAQFQNELSRFGLSQEWEEAWSLKGAHPYNELIRNLPDSDQDKPYGMLTKYHGSPVKGCDVIAGTVFKDFKKNQELVLIKSQNELQNHKGNLLLFGKAPVEYLEKLLKIGFNGTIFQIALRKQCNLKTEVHNLNNLAFLDNGGGSINWSLPINIRLIESKEQSPSNQLQNPLVDDLEVPVISSIPNNTSLNNIDLDENLEEIDIADYFEKNVNDDINQEDKSGNVFTSTTNTEYKVSSDRVTFFSENDQFILKFGTPKINDIAILPMDETFLRRSLMNLHQKFNLEFWPDHDLWKRALQNWINQSTMHGVLDVIGSKFNAIDINRYKKRDQTEPGAPDYYDDFVYLINHIKNYGLFQFTGATKMKEFDVDSHWNKIRQKRSIHRDIGKDFFEIIHQQLSMYILSRPAIDHEIPISLFGSINGLFSAIKINNITLEEE